jgi:hypothetical protein
MKKLIVKIAVLTGFFGLAALSANADIIVEGRAISTTQADGNTYVTCKKKNAECIRIVSAIAIVTFEDGTQTMYSIDGYEIAGEFDSGTVVVLYGTK